MLIKGYSDFYLRMPGPHLGASKRIARFKLEGDVAQLFSYINAVAQDVVYYEKPHYIQFTLDGSLCALYPDRAEAGFFPAKEDAFRFIKGLIDFLNDLFYRKGSIKPDHKKQKYIPVLDVFKLLPRTNCKECGFSTCIAFAAALSKGEALPDKCPELENPIHENAVFPVYDKDGNLASTIMIGIDTKERKNKLEKQNEYVKSLEKKISAITQEKTKNLDGDNSEARFGLTAREIEALHFMAEGFTNTEISNLLSISPHTVKSHVIHIFNKIGVNDRTQASVRATRYKII